MICYKKLSVGIFIFWNLHLRFFLITFKSKYNYFYKSGTVLIILGVAEMTYGGILPENIMYDSELMLNSFFYFFVKWNEFTSLKGMLY